MIDRAGGPNLGPGRAREAGNERSALLVSVWVSLALATAALALGILSDTRVILFDGAYIAIGLILSLGSVRAASVAGTGPTNRYPFGRDALTPLVVTIQGLALAGTLVYVAADAVLVLRAGGSVVDPGVIAAYGAVTAAVSFIVAALLRRRAPGTDLVAAESAQWRAGALMSAGMVAAALIAAVLIAVGLDPVARHVDLVLVLAACCALASTPVRLIVGGVNELLEGAPSPVLSSRIAAVVEAVRSQFDLPTPRLRAGKVGQKLYVEASFFVDGAAWTCLRRTPCDGLWNRAWGFWVWMCGSLSL